MMQSTPHAAESLGGAPAPVRAWRVRRVVDALTDPAIAAALFIGYLLLLLTTVHDLGYARDEGFYFQAADSYGKWFELLFSDPGRALQRASVDQFWSNNHEHPALMKSLFWLSREYLYGLPLIDEQGTAYRFPGMVLSSMAVATVYSWGRRALDRVSGFVAAALFAFMPRIFYHAHLDCFDMPVAAMWLVTTYAYIRAWQARGWLWPILTAILYGLLLNTKHNSWLLPGALVLHFFWVHGSRLKRNFQAGVVHVPIALFCMLTIGPLLFYLTWPWIWFDTGDRLAEYVKFHAQHVYYNMEFLGQTYFKPPMPRLYAPVMTVATVPFITLLLFGVGLWVWLRVDLARPIAWVNRLIAHGMKRTLAEPGVDHAASKFSREQRPTWILWAVCILTSYAPWLSTNTPIFGGTKHWITAYPFVCLFAAVGFSYVRDQLWPLIRGGESAPASRLRYALLTTTLTGVTLAGPVVMTLSAHPWGLSAYTPIVGGAPGAASLGLNRSFWGYTTGAVQEQLNEQAPKRARVFIHDTAMQSWRMMQRDGRLRKDLKGWWSVHGSDVALYHYEQHMSRVEFMVWVDYETTQPAIVGAHDGVPIVWVYIRPD